VSRYLQSASSPLDALLAFTGGDTSFVQTLMTSWSTQSEELLRNAIQAVYWFDVPEFLRSVHTLGGSSGALGLQGLADACAHTERALRSGSNRPLGEYLGWIVAAYRVAKIEASHMLTDLSLSRSAHQEV
jgi:HPt (histidine-containing phosphotransfer) domain-containing protein